MQDLQWKLQRDTQGSSAQFMKEMFLRISRPYSYRKNSDWTNSGKPVCNKTQSCKPEQPALKKYKAGSP